MDNEQKNKLDELVNGKWPIFLCLSLLQVTDTSLVPMHMTLHKVWHHSTKQYSFILFGFQIIQEFKIQC